MTKRYHFLQSEQGAEMVAATKASNVPLLPTGKAVVVLLPHSNSVATVQWKGLFWLREICQTSRSKFQRIVGAVSPQSWFGTVISLIGAVRSRFAALLQCCATLETSSPLGCLNENLQALQAMPLAVSLSCKQAGLSQEIKDRVLMKHAWLGIDYKIVKIVAHRQADNLKFQVYLLWTQQRFAICSLLSNIVWSPLSARYQISCPKCD